MPAEKDGLKDEEEGGWTYCGLGEMQDEAFETAMEGMTEGISMWGAVIDVAVEATPKNCAGDEWK